MRVVLFLYCMLVLSSAFAAVEPHAYMKKDYNEAGLDPDKAVSKFLEITFPDAYGLDLLSFNGHFKLIVGSSPANIIIMPDLADNISTRASTMQFILREMKARDAILFVHDPINQDKGQTSPQKFVCKYSLYRAPSYIEPSDFLAAFHKQSVPILSKIRQFDGCRCYRLALDRPSPGEIKSHIDTIASAERPPLRYFVVMDQRQLPNQKNAKYAVQDWNSAFGENGYEIWSDLYTQTTSE